jgi:NAD+ kinase
MSAPARRVTVLTHRRPAEVAGALRVLQRLAERTGVELRFDPEETRKHGVEADGGCLPDAPLTTDVDLCIALGGDGTILQGLRAYIDTDIPVFAVNYGEVGFLATVDPDDVEAGLARALAGDFEVLRLPAISLDGVDGRLFTGLNDVSFHRKPGMRVADLSYAIEGEEIGRVRCDGLVVATPAGSTGYNLANGGPVMAWGVEGYAVSFIAPHSLTARALVVAPADGLSVHNRSQGESLDASIDGRPACELAAGRALGVRFRDDAAALAQLPGASFYHRLREKFGRLAS